MPEEFVQLATLPSKQDESDAKARRVGWFRYRMRRGRIFQRRYRRVYTPLTNWGLRYLKGPAQLLKNRLNFFSTKYTMLGNMTKRIGLGALSKQLVNWPYCFTYLILSKDRYVEFKQEIMLSDRAVMEGQFAHVVKKTSEMLFGRLSILKNFGLGTSLTAYASNIDQALRVWLELQSKNLWCTAVGCWGRFVSPTYFLTNLLGLSTTVGGVFKKFVSHMLIIKNIFSLLFILLKKFLVSLSESSLVDIIK